MALRGAPGIEDDEAQPRVMAVGGQEMPEVPPSC